MTIWWCLWPGHHPMVLRLHHRPLPRDRGQCQTHFPRHLPFLHLHISIISQHHHHQHHLPGLTLSLIRSSRWPTTRCLRSIMRIPTPCKCGSWGREVIINILFSVIVATCNPVWYFMIFDDIWWYLMTSDDFEILFFSDWCDPERRGLTSESKALTGHSLSTTWEGWLNSI